MKRIIRTIFYFLAVSPVYMACEDNRLNNMAEDKIYIVNSGMDEINVIDFGSYTHQIALNKSGYGSSDARAHLVMDLDALLNYNQKEGARYEVLPYSCYQLQSAETAVNAADTRFFIPVTFNTAEMAKLQDRSKYALPVRVVADGVEVNREKESVVLLPVFNNAYIQLSPNGLTPEYPIGIYAEDSYTMHTTVGTNYKNEWDLTYRIATDAAYVTAYNAANNTSFMPLPANAFELKPDEWSLAAGTSSKDISLNIIKKNLVDGNGDYIMGDYVIPLKITEVSKWDVDPNNVQLLHVPFQSSNIPKGDWELLGYNSAYSDREGNEWLLRGPAAIIDDINAKHTYADVQTFWLADWEVELPYWMIFDMKMRHKILRMELTLPLGGDNWRRSIKKGRIEVSDDNITWTPAGDFEKTDASADFFAFDLPQPADGRYLKLVFTENVSNDNGVAVMNLDVIGF
ncbi:MAG: DUF1735 domain-containing protein [Bacteroidales bacterium]|nr:DUF1735 domain-containing protein [Bacteroidales bacterium]